MTDQPPTIVVAGDVCIDWFAIPVPRVADTPGSQPAIVPNWRLSEGIRMFARPGGAWLLADLVECTVGQAVLRQEMPTPLEHQSCDDALHSMVELRPFPLSNAEKDRREVRSYVWRVDRFRGFAGPPTGSCQRSLVAVKDDSTETRLVVIDDVGNGFRDRQEAWPSSIRQDADGPLVLWKLARPLDGSPLARRLLGKAANRTILVVDVDDLRAAGAVVSRRLSWERTAGDIIQTLNHDRTFSELRRASHLIVRLDLEGAIHFARSSDGRIDEAAVELTYMPAAIEGSTRSAIPGDMLGGGSAFVAMLAAELSSGGATSGYAAERIKIGVRRGMTSSRQLLVAGLGPSSGEPRTLDSSLKSPTNIPDEFVTLNVAPFAGRDPGSRLLDYVRKVPLEIVAERILEQGTQLAIPQAPVARFGDFETLDRPEIETYRSIRNLIGEYLAQATPERPLSVAVFGPPGSGKSFGVAQVAKSLADIEKIEFNVSQFEGAKQLISSFHIVRDSVVRGRVPLVFFDEFDAAANGWLKYFLAPMQDGKFVDGESTHLIGRAVFVFAGGTKPTFAKFAQLKDDAFIKAKGPDFVSRLRGIIDVRGTDRREHNDDMYIVRRAVLLRSLLKRKAPALFNASGTLRIAPGVRRAFLRCGSFAHGARSIESLIDMSLLSGRERFEPASLPSSSQLSVHVNSEEFMELVNQDVRLSELRDVLGKAIHDRFVAQQTGKKASTDPGMQPWDSLAENYREDNRQQADDISRKLALVNCGCRKMKPGIRPEPIDFSPEEIEKMAEKEHERWNDSKRVQGYTYGPKRDDVGKTHPSLLPWADLPDTEKDKDRATVRGIQSDLESVGFEAFRLT